MSLASSLRTMASLAWTRKWWICLLTLLGAVALSMPQTAQGQLSIPFSESFDDQSQFSVTQGALTQNGNDSYFILAQNANPSIDQSYNNSGTNFLAGQNTDQDGDNTDEPQITWSDIDISGVGSLQFIGGFGANGSGYEESDFLLVEYRIDGGSWQNLLAFRGDPDGNLAEDTDFDDTGDGEIINIGALSSFSTQIGGTGNTLDLRFTASTNANGEDFAVDDFKVASSFVQFTSPTGTVSEAEGQTSLAVEIISPPSGTSVSADVVFSGGSAESSDLNGFGTKTVTFPSGASSGDTETVTVNLATGDGSEGSENALFDLQNLSVSSAAPGTPAQFDLTIKDGVSDHNGDVLITELMPDPDAAGDGDGEYIELYNATASDINADSWTIDVGGDTDALSGVTIPSRGFVVLCVNDDTSVNGGIRNCDLDYADGISLNNGGETVALLDGSGNTVDAVTYSNSDPWPDPTGASLIFSGTTANDDGGNWARAARRERGYAQDQSGDDGSPGRNGTGQVLQPTAEITGPAEWRMLSAPVGGVNPDTLAQVSLVQGVGDHFPNAAPNLYQWPGGTDNNVDWTAPSSATTDLTSSGKGYIWYVFDSAQTPFTDTPPFTLSVPGTPRTSNVTTGSLQEGFHLLGNPYAQSFDVSALNLGAQNFQTTVQVWDPSAGTYEPVLQSSTDEDFVGAYQGFFVECVSTNSCSGNTLTFDASGRRADSVGLKSMEKAPPRIEFRLVGRDGDGAVLTRDEAFALHAPDGATPGWDVHDATKLTPLSGRYATAAFRDSVNGERRLKSVASIPSTLPEEGLELPVSLQLQGTDPVETLRWTWPTWKNVPDAWSITLYDAAADSTINLRTQSEYAFAPPTPKRQSAPPPASPMARPSHIRAKAGADSARFVLLVQPTSIPVELADFDATRSGETVELRWTTASETNNAGFHVEHRGPDASQFASTGFVEGHGTTDQPRRYRYRTGPLDPGRHVFRLRQVNLDGTATRSDTVAVRIQLASAAKVTVAPNPVRDRATVSLRIRAKQPVTVTLYDVLGRRVRTLHDGAMVPGRGHTFRINATGLSSGPYLLRAKGAQFQKTRRITVVR